MKAQEKSDYCVHKPAAPESARPSDAASYSKKEIVTVRVNEVSKEIPESFRKSLDTGKAAA